MKNPTTLEVLEQLTTVLEQMTDRIEQSDARINALEKQVAELMAWYQLSMKHGQTPQ
jgi:CRISPR/Cas system CSM-associated protein Csm2 small subunit